MLADKNTPRLLGVAFLIQAIASVLSTLVLLDPLIVSGDIVATMTNIANSASQMRASMALQMITAAGIVFLAAMLFVVLKKQNMKVALTAMGLYGLEAAILAASIIPLFALLVASQEAVATGHPAALQSLAKLLYEGADYGNWLHMVPFVFGATMFYSLLYKSGYIPRWLAIWGLAAVLLALVGVIFVLFGYDIPLIVFLPNLPFELTIGIWLLIKGIEHPEWQ